MRVLILDEQGKQKDIEPKHILIQGITLIDYIKEQEEFKREVRKFMSNFHTREEELHKLWSKIK